MKKQPRVNSRVSRSTSKAEIEIQNMIVCTLLNRQHDRQAYQYTFVLNQFIMVLLLGSGRLQPGDPVMEAFILIILKRRSITVRIHKTMRSGMWGTQLESKWL